MYLDGKMVQPPFNTKEEAENCVYNTKDLLCFEENVLWKIEEWNCSPNENYQLYKQKIQEELENRK